MTGEQVRTARWTACGVLNGPGWSKAVHKSAVGLFLRERRGQTVTNYLANESGTVVVEITAGTSPEAIAARLKQFEQFASLCNASK
jgi:hypothetical protein